MATIAQNEELGVIPPPNETKPRSTLNWEELRNRSLQPGGFGAERRTIWPKLLNVKTPPLVAEVVDGQATATPEENSEDDKESLSDQNPAVADEAEPKVEHRDENQIKLDTDRSFVLYPEESEAPASKVTLQSNLNHLIVSVFRKRPKLNYFQGYHDIMTVLYLTLPFELRLACAEELSLHRLRDSMLHTLEPVLGLLRVLKNLLRLVDPDYAKLLERDSPLPFYALSNLLTLFAHDTPTLPLIQHIFDYLLCRPPIAVVYLAASVLLSRKQYILGLEGQFEPFMLHPILSSLPPLSEGFELPQEEAPDTDGASQTEDKPSPSGSDIAHKRETEDDLAALRQSKPGTFQSTTPDAKQSTHNVDYVDNPIGSGSSANGAIKQEFLDDLPPADINNHNNDTLKIPTGEKRISPEPSLLDPEHPTLNSPLLIPSSPSQPSTSIPEPEPSSFGTSDLPSTKPLPLPIILSHADTLYAEYPPSHASLRLSSIMGPQSVVFTWSENFGDLPSDMTAEAMVARPELVVYPISPEEMEEEASDEGEEDSSGTESGSGRERGEKQQARARRGGSRKGKKGGIRRGDGKDRTVWRKGRKTVRKKIRKLLTTLGADSSDQQIDGRTMVVGAAIALGVAAAVYGIKAHGPSGNTPGASGEDRIGASLHVLARHLQEHRRGHMPDELKKMTSALVGFGARFLNLGGVGQPAGG